MVSKEQGKYHIENESSTGRAVRQGTLSGICACERERRAAGLVPAARTPLSSCFASIAPIANGVMSDEHTLGLAGYDAEDVLG